MSTYTPDAWVILEVTSPQYGKIRKILAGWYGGYCGSDFWKISSGNLEEHLDGDFIVFPQESGSTYRCHSNCQRLTGCTSTTLSMLKDNFKDTPGTTIEIINYE